MNATKTHWKQLVNTDYIGAYALDGQDMTLTIKMVRHEQITGTNGKKEVCPVAYFREEQKPMILNRTNMKQITKLYSSPYVEDWEGKKITLYPTTTKLGGEVVECLRIRPTIPKATAAAIICEGCGATIQAANRMSAAQIADYTKDKYGKQFCTACAKAEAERRAAENAASNSAESQADTDGK